MEKPRPSTVGHVCQIWAQSGHGDDSGPRGRFRGLCPGLDLSSTHVDWVTQWCGPIWWLDGVSGGWVVKSGGSWCRHVCVLGTWVPMLLPLGSLFSFFFLSSPTVLPSLLLLLHPVDPELQAYIYLQVGLLGLLITGARARWAPSSLRTTDAGAAVWEGLSPSGWGRAVHQNRFGHDQALCKYHYEAIIYISASIKILQNCNYYLK